MNFQATLRLSMLFFDEDSDDSSSESSTSDSDFSDNETDDDMEGSYLLPINSVRPDVPRTFGYYEYTVQRMDELLFRSHFRLNRRLVDVVGNMIMRDPQFVLIQSVTLRKQLLMTLWLIATPESFRSVADRFDVSKSMLWLAVIHTCSAIARLSPNVIKWPSQADMRASELDFYQMAAFPGVIGCVDGTHIPISAPKLNPSNYINRKDFHSIVLQGIANSKLQFIDCYVGEVGSVHDARVFANSEIGAHLADLIPANFHLLGDCAYPLRVNLLTPFRDNGHLTRRQVVYNKKLSRTRSTIERAFGLLKNRFRRLKSLVMNRTDLVPTIVMACCVLHNLMQADPELEEDFEVEVEDDDDEEQQDTPNSMAVAKRIEIMNRFRA